MGYWSRYKNYVLKEYILQTQKIYYWALERRYSIKQKNVTPDLSNVIPLVRTLEAVPVSTPEWAIGTDLYFEPRYFSSK